MFISAYFAYFIFPPLPGLDIGYVPAARMPFWGCRASSGHHNLYSTDPRGQWFFYFIFLVLRMPPLFLLGIGKTRKATLIRTYFSLYSLMYKSVQLHAWNHKFPLRKHFWVITCFWGASGFFGGPVDFLIHWPPGPVVAKVQCQGLPSFPS